MTKQPEISVIVPVYNVEKYLKRCVQSVLEQTFEDFELILVDDCSPDKSGMLCDELEKSDSRIKVIHREKNGGLSAARNSGLDARNGNYVLFLDSDDFLHKDALRVLFDLTVQNGADVVIGEHIAVYGDDKIEMGNGNNVALKKGREALLKDIGRCISACGKLFKSTLFDELRFIEGRWHEDVHFSYRLYSNDINIALTDKVVYANYHHKESYSAQKYSPKKIDDALFIFEDGVNFFASKNDEELRLIAARKHLYMAKACYVGARDDMNDKERMSLSHASFKRVFETVDKSVFDKDTYKLYKAFAATPKLYLQYEKMYWLIKGIINSLKRRIKGN